MFSEAKEITFEF